MMQVDPVRAILFDMDNTLIDWSGFGEDWREMERRHLRGVYEFVCDEGYNPSGSFDEFVLHYTESVVAMWQEARNTLRAPHMGRTLAQALAEFGCNMPDGEIAACLHAYGWGAVEGVSAYEDVVDALTNLQERGIRMGIVTNAYQPMWLRDLELEHYGLLPFFAEQKTRISAADVGYLKPHPQIFQHALEQIGTRPEETLFVGDNVVADIAGAQGAGMRAVLRVNHPAPNLLSGLIVPDAAINTFHELLGLVDDWEGYTTFSDAR
jgi:putative hydrolase of the HAD superfamily